MKRAALLALALGAALSCGEPSGPKAGLLKISLATPFSGSDGAVLLTVTGPAPLTSLTASPGLRAFTDTLGVSTKVVVTGVLLNGVIAEIGVEDVGAVAQYSATLVQAAASTYQLRATAGYSLSVIR